MAVALKIAVWRENGENAPTPKGGEDAQISTMTLEGDRHLQ